jgi:hypothetical protein
MAKIVFNFDLEVFCKKFLYFPFCLSSSPINSASLCNFEVAKILLNLNFLTKFRYFFSIFSAKESNIDYAMTKHFMICLCNKNSKVEKTVPQHPAL